MDPYHETFETWHEIAGLYQEKFMDLDLYNGTYDAFCKAVRTKNARILDIGCGPGNISKYLLSKRPDFELEGIDVAPGMIELARRNNPGASFNVMDVRHLDQLGTRYNGIIGGFCLPYLPEAEVARLIANTARLLTDQGHLYLSYVAGDPEKSGFLSGSGGRRVYFHYHQPDQVHQFLLTAGFEKPALFHVNYPGAASATEEHTILITRKKKEDPHRFRPG